jgi:hypothetical protein
MTIAAAIAKKSGETNIASPPNKSSRAAQTSIATASIDDFLLHLLVTAIITKRRARRVKRNDRY